MPLDQAHFSHDAAAILKDGRLAFAKGVHDLKALDRGIGGLHRFEPTHWLDQLFQLAVIGFDNDAHQPVRSAAGETAPSAPVLVAGSGAPGSDQLFSAGLEGERPSPALVVAPLVPQQFPVVASLSPFSGVRAPAADGSAFELTLSGQSWTELTDGNGARVAFGTLQAGSRSFGGQAPYTLLLGNASVAQLRIGGQLLERQRRPSRATTGPLCFASTANGMAGKLQICRD